MSDLPDPVIYQLKVVLQGISPMIWRRLLVKSDSTINDLHYIIQIAMGWEDIHLHYFTIHGQQYGVWRPGGGMSFNIDASVIKLSQFEFREKEKFLYESDSAYVFQSNRHSPLAKDTISGIIEQGGKLAGLPFPVHTHMLRHSTGYYLANHSALHGFSPGKISGTLGWLKKSSREIS